MIRRLFRLDFVFFFVILLLSTLVEGIIQNIFIILALIDLNFLAFRMLDRKIMLKAILASGLCFTLCFVFLAYWQYFNAQAFGFDDGLLHGVVGSQSYSDTRDYYYEAIKLSDVFAGSSLNYWLSGDYHSFGFYSYGPYNPFNIWNAFLIILFGDNLLTLILIKCIFSVFSVYLLYNISSIYIKNNRYALIPVWIYNVYPGYLLVTASLLRDNIISFCILALFKIFSSTLESNSGLKSEIKMLLLFFILFLLRNYAAVILIMVLVILYVNWTQISLKRYFFSVVALSSVFFSVFYFYGWDRITNNLLKYDQSQVWDTNRVRGLNLFFYTIYYTLFGNTPWAEHFNFILFPEMLGYLSSIYLNLILFIYTIIMVLHFLGKYKYYDIRVIYFSYLFSLASLFLITYIYGGTVPRLYIMWLWLVAIVIGIFFELVENYTKLLVIFGSIGFVSAVYLLKYLMMNP